MGMLLARRAPPDQAIVAGILVALIPASLLALFVLCERLQWQYSVRTLLIATTLVAVVLGLVIFAAR
jgi:hypothetical protein